MRTFSPISTALLSYGMSGEVFHAPLLTAHHGFHLSKICERSHDKAAKRYGHDLVVRDPDEVLSDTSVELVVVNTPNETHYRYAASALEAGKHVVVEKPFTVTVQEGEALIELAKKKGLILSVFQNRRWDGDFLTLRKLLQSDVLGRVVEYEAHYDRYRPVADLSTWKETDHPGSGILYNLGSHMIDQALLLFGVPQSLDARVGIQREKGEAEDFYDIRMQYQDGLQVILKSSYLVREPGPRYIVHGEKGSFVKWGLDPQEEALKKGSLPGTSGWGEESESDWGILNTELMGLSYRGRIQTLPGNYLGYYDNIYDAIRDGKDLAVKAAESLNTGRVIEAAYKSSKTRSSMVM